MMDILDPVTGDKLDVWGSEVNKNEVWICNNARVVNILMRQYSISEDEAKNKLAMSDVNNPVKMTDVIDMDVWCE